MNLCHMEGMRKDFSQKYLVDKIKNTIYLKAVRVIAAGVVQQLYNQLSFEKYSKAVNNRSMLYKRLCQYLGQFLGEGDRTAMVATLREGIFKSTFGRRLHAISSIVSRIQTAFISSMGSLDQEHLEGMLWPVVEIKSFAQSDYLMLADEKVAFPEAKKRDLNPEIATLVSQWSASRREIRRCIISDKIDLVENTMRKHYLILSDGRLTLDGLGVLVEADLTRSDMSLKSIEKCILGAKLNVVSAAM